jgi:hypothetical protein
MTDTIPTDNTVMTFDSRDQAASFAEQLIDSARQEICFFGPIIDPVLLDNDAVISKISEFARRSQRTRLRLVVHDTQKNVLDSHRLLPLAQRLTSHIQIHLSHPKYQDQRSLFLLVDQQAYLYCPNGERYQGRADLQPSAYARELQKQFEEFWSHSRPDTNSRRLHI